MAVLAEIASRSFVPHHLETAWEDGFRCSRPSGALILRVFVTLTERAVRLPALCIALGLIIGAGFRLRPALVRGEAQRGAVLIDEVDTEVRGSGAAACPGGRGVSGAGRVAGARRVSGARRASGARRSAGGGASR